MDVCKKLLEYEEMLKDGVLSEAEFQKLKSILYSQKMAEMGIQDEAVFEEALKKSVFRAAIFMLENNTVASYRAAIFWLEKLGDWGNAAAVIEQCRPELIELEKQEEAERAEKAREDLYNSALQLLKKNTVADHNKAIKSLETLGNWKDAKGLIEKAKSELPSIEKKEAEAKAAYDNAKRKKKKMIVWAIICIGIIAAGCLCYEKIIKPSNRYLSAWKLYSEGRYEEAIEIYETLDGYKDSEYQIEVCKSAIKNREYEAAIALYNAGKYEEAIIAFEALDGYSDSEAQIQACRYGIAMELYNAGKYDEAYPALIALNGYKDSADKAKEIYGKYKETILKNAEPGDYIIFGSYEQDNNKSNGKEEIEWEVLAKDGDKILVVSRYALTSQPFNSSGGSATWETCSLREWMNDTFYNEAFTADEQNMIQSTVVTADVMTENGETKGNDTTDKVFLLSLSEFEKYISKRATHTGTIGDDFYLLRTVYTNGAYDFVTVADNYENTYRQGCDFGSINLVRPAIWIDLGQME